MAEGIPAADKQQLSAVCQVCHNNNFYTALSLCVGKENDVSFVTEVDTVNSTILQPFFKQKEYEDYY